MSDMSGIRYLRLHKHNDAFLKSFEAFEKSVTVCVKSTAKSHTDLETQDILSHDLSRL